MLGSNDLAGRCNNPVRLPTITELRFISSGGHLWV